MRGDLAERFLAQAVEDLHWASYLRDAGGFNLACFLSQQPAAKTMKALLCHLGQEPTRSASVVELCQRAAASMPDITDKCTHWGVLDGFYVPTRYPDALPGSIPAEVYDRRTADDAVATVTEVVETARAKMTG